MGDYDSIELDGAERQEALSRVEAQIKAWGLVMPAVTPIPLHFGLHDFYQTGETEYWIANEKDAGYCGKFLFVFDGQTCPYHFHKIKHETFFIVKGSVRMLIDGVGRIMCAGDTLAMLPGTRHSFTGSGPALLLEASMPSILNDNFFSDVHIGSHGVI